MYLINYRIINIYTIILVILYTIDATIVTMHGSEYIEYDLTRNKLSSEKLVVVFKFRTVNPTGLILFSHNKETGDFISVELIDGYIRYKGQLGVTASSKQEIVAGAGLNDHKWHVVDLRINGNNVTLNILNKQKITKTFNSQFKRLDLDDKVYFGGVDDSRVDLTPFKISKRKFSGCLESFFFDDHDILYNAKFSKPGYQITGDLLWNKCPELNYYPIMFKKRQDYSLVPTHLKNSLNVVFKFRTHVGEGLLFAKISPMITVYLYLEKGVLIYKTQISGQGPLTMTRGKNLHDGFWHRVEILVNQKTIYLKLDDYSELSHQSHWGHLIEFTIGNATIGGGEEQVVSGFTGCMYDIWVDNTVIFYRELGPAYLHGGTEGCDLKDLCLFSKCQNGGKCVQDHDSFRCDCFHTMYDGNYCEKSIYQPSCQEYKELGLNEDSTCLIDPDGNGGMKPVEVLCNMTRYDDKAVTIFTHNLSNKQTLINTGYYSKGMIDHTLIYKAKMEEFDKLLEHATSCRQYVQYKCKNAPLMNSPAVPTDTLWMGRTGHLEQYWGGAAPDSGHCACGNDFSCDHPFRLCNCDIADNNWREDSGYFKELDRLPVLVIQFKERANNSFFMVGNLECQYNVTQDVKKLSKLRVLKACTPLNAPKTTKKPTIIDKLNQKETFISFKKKFHNTENGKSEHKIYIDKPVNVNLNFTVELPKVGNEKKDDSSGFKLTLSVYAIITIAIAVVITLAIIFIIKVCKNRRQRERRRRDRTEDDEDGDESYRNDDSTEMCTFFGSVSSRADRNRPVLEVHRHSFHLDGIDDLPPAYRGDLSFRDFHEDFQQPIHTHIDLSYKSRKKGHAIFC